jgi:hypothetical protein
MKSILNKTIEIMSKGRNPTKKLLSVEQGEGNHFFFFFLKENDNAKIK